VSNIPSLLEHIIKHKKVSSVRFCLKFYQVYDKNINIRNIKSLSLDMLDMAYKIISSVFVCIVNMNVVFGISSNIKRFDS
jgi:hypothetical protein